MQDARYSRARHPAPPRKIGSALSLFDCVVPCNICLPVCPNDANFPFVIPPGTYPVQRLIPTAGEWLGEPAGALVYAKHRQVGNFADACNECGNCGVFCGQDGGPQFAKPRFFGSVAAWQDTPDRDGFAFAVHGPTVRMHGRFDGQEVLLETTPGRKTRYVGRGFDIRLHIDDPVASVEGHADAPVDLRWLRIMDLIRAAVAAPEANNFVSTGLVVRAMA